MPDNAGTPTHSESLIEEIEGLARAIDLRVISTHSVNLRQIQSGSFFGKGQREMLGTDIAALEPDIVIVNHSLSPVQQRNLEKEWNAKIIDRTGLILEIFGARAQTKEGRIQVELAALDYQRSRLVRSWTHLERQRGGAGFMGGPGERQIEIDRRLIDQRITRLKKQLEDVRRTRSLGRESRARVPFPVIALVGYTNAGKSTLFNALTNAGVFAEDLPFATLDPTMRRITLPGDQPAILSDTVGFISNLPTHLVESFRATLEQINYADVIAHVIDVSRPDYREQKRNVIQILTDLGVEYESDPRVLELHNKIDLLSEDEQDEIARQAKTRGNLVPISAITGQGIDTFLNSAAAVIGRHQRVVSFALPVADGSALAWLYAHGQIIEREDGESDISVSVKIEPARLGQFKDLYGYEETTDEPEREHG